MMATVDAADRVLAAVVAVGPDHHLLLLVYHILLVVMLLQLVPLPTHNHDDSRLDRVAVLHRVGLVVSFLLLLLRMHHSVLVVVDGAHSSWLSHVVVGDVESSLSREKD